jgi:hypothetical protein
VLVEQALTSEKTYTDVEAAQVRLRAQEIKNRVAELNRELIETTDEAQVANKATELNTLVNEFDRLSQAARKAGTEWGRAGVARQQAIDQDYSLVGMIANFRRSKRGVETPAERAAIQQVHDALPRAEAKLADATTRAAESHLQRQINRTPRQQRRAEKLSV